MTRGHGSLFVATRVGVAVANIPVRASGEPGRTWWTHHCGCAWVAAWLTVRGREMIAGRELLGRRDWSAEINWRDHKGQHTSGHRPDLVGVRDDRRPVAIEGELAQKSVERLQAIFRLHAAWRAAGKTNGVQYVCGDMDGCERIATVAAAGGSFSADDPGLRVRLLATITTEAIEAREARHSESGFRRPGAHSVGHGS